MEKIWRSLEAGFLGGVIIAAGLAGFAGLLCLLCWLMDLTRPKEVRQKEKRMLSKTLSHRIYKACWRGRIAYLVLCLEEALRFYEQDFSAWEWILRRMWSITDCSEENWMDIWLDSVGEVLPSDVLTNNDAEAAPAEIISKARTLYTQAGAAAMIVINTIIDNAYSIVCGWGPDTAKDDPDAVLLIDKVEETMMEFRVPLPSNESIQPLFKKKDWPFGEPFDGLRLSYLSKRK